VENAVGPDGGDADDDDDGDDDNNGVDVEEPEGGEEAEDNRPSLVFPAERILPENPNP
jgi:hypothetical protein